MAVVSTVFHFIVVIGILVLVHELGHFLAAKLFRMRVDRFSIGFPPRAWGKKIGDTDYCISWLPIGGYVKIAGMIDESMDTAFVNAEPQPWEFRSKPIWQRMVVISAGVIMNIVLAVLIFWMIAFTHGRIVRPVTDIGFVTPDSPAAKAGLQMNDKVVAINGTTATQWDEIESAVYGLHTNDRTVLTVDRNGRRIDVPIGRDLIPDLADEPFGIYPAGLKALVASVEHGKPAEHIGLQPGDTIVAVNGAAASYGALPQLIKQHAGKEILLTWKRGNERLQARVTPTGEGKIGVSLLAAYQGPAEHLYYTLFGALPVGAMQVWEASVLNIANVRMIMTGKISFSKSVGGPIKIAQMANRSAESGIVTFLAFVGVLSISLALLNILPFPALDGGHLVFLVYEVIFRREVPAKVRMALQQAGFVLLLVFMAFVLYNDIVTF